MLVCSNQSERRSCPIWCPVTHGIGWASFHPWSFFLFIGYLFLVLTRLLWAVEFVVSAFRGREWGKELLEAEFLRARKVNVIVFASGVPFHGDVGPCYGFIRSSFSYCRAQEKEVKYDNVTKGRTGDSLAERFRAQDPVVRRPISANPGLNFNPVFVFCFVLFFVQKHFLR